MIHKTNKLIISAQKKNWHINANMERVFFSLIFFAKAKTEIKLLVIKTMQSKSTNIRIKGSVIKIIKDDISPITKMMT